jgi:hypothetical protein
MRRRVTVIFRRIAALAVAGVLTLAPTGGYSLGEAAETVPGTDCTIGNETLTYDHILFDWFASATILCATNRNELALSVSAVLVQGTRNSLAIDGPGIFCLDCPALQHRVRRGSQWMAPGIYQVRSTALVYADGRPPMAGRHASCFLVREFDAKTLMAGCPPIN